jgi:uncharacterized membrane protein YkoI
MNTIKLRSKRVTFPAIAAIVAVLIGGAVWISAASADVQGSERERVASAATEAVGGTAIEVETSDDRGEAYEVEVRKEDGTEVEVSLDKDLAVVRRDAEDRDDQDDSDRDDRDEAPETDDRALNATERASAEEAALNAVAGGTVTEVDASDDQGVAYEVEVRDGGNREWDVDLDADFTVVSKSLDD